MTESLVEQGARAFSDGYLAVWEGNGCVPTRAEWLAQRARSDAFYESVTDDQIDRWNEYRYLCMYDYLKPDARSVCLVRRSDGLTRIAVTGNPRNRVRAIGREIGQETTLVRAWDVPNAEGLGMALYYHLEDNRRDGGWYALTDEDVEAIGKRIVRWLSIIAEFDS